MKPGIRGQATFIALGIVLVGAGLVSIVRPFLNVRERNAADIAALQAWRGGGSLMLQGAVAGRSSLPATTPPAACASGGSGSDAFALVTFPSLAGFGYAGVAVDGDWNSLLARSMVHWKGSAGPGESGNMIIAFHREPDYEHIDRLAPGATVDVQDRSCHTYTYQVISSQDLDPAKVTQLVQTTGHDLTLITCTPFWQDYHRLVWRANLVKRDGQAYAGA